MPEVEVNGTKLAYSEQGAGQPVLFVHGGTADLRVWASQVEEFVSKYRAIALSCRHYYPNEPIQENEALHLGTVVEDLAGFVKALDLAPLHFVGHSSPGAFACLLLAKRKPALVRTLVLAEPPVLPLLGVSIPPRPSQILALLLRDPRAAAAFVRFGVRGIAPASRAFGRGDDELGLQTFLKAVLGDRAFAGLSEARLQQARDNVRPLKAQLQAGFPAFSEKDACRISMPTLLVTGQHSASILHRIADWMESLIPNVERLDIEGASHLMFQDNPNVFNRQTLSFLDKH